MGCNTIIYYGDLIPDATLTASTEVTDYEKEFLQDWTPQSQWLSSADPSTMAVDNGATIPHQAAIWVGGSNLVSADVTYTYTTGAAAPAATNVYPLDKQANSFSEIGDTLRYGLVDINKNAGNGGMGKIYLAQYKYEFTKDMKATFTAGTSTVWVTVKGRYGQIHREKQYEKYTNSFEIVGMGDTQKEILDETIRNEENILFKDSESGEVYFGAITLSTPTSINVKSAGVTWKISGTFEEAK